MLANYPQILRGINKIHIRNPYTHHFNEIFSFSINRCNSKASYLPRQSREKLNIDPDHGIYKLTLTSNEDCITSQHHQHHNNNNHHQQQFHHSTDLLLTKSSATASPAKCNNLPDVLPLGVKIHHHQQHHQPASSPRYGSNNNLSGSQQQLNKPHTAPINYQQHHHHQHQNGYASSSPQQQQQQPQSAGHHPLKSVFNFNLNRHNAAMPSPPSPQLTGNSSESISTSPVKYVTQSVIDLKQNHILQDTMNNKCPISQEPSSATDLTKSPYSIRHEFVNRSSTDEQRPPAKKDTTDKVIRKDSLKENIDKITQLQTKLMSAHDKPEKLSSAAREAASLRKNRPSEMPAIHTATSMPVDEIAEAAQELITASSPANLLLLNGGSKAVDGLRLMQRTEIVLRVNAATSEAASQTDESSLDFISSQIAANTSIIPSNGDLKDAHDDDDDDDMKKSRRRRSPFIRSESAAAEIDCAQLSQDLIRQLSPTDRLHHILGKFSKTASEFINILHDIASTIYTAPKSHRSSADYVSGLFNPHIAPRLVKKDVSTSTPHDSPIPR